jgi:hypothetical protein
MRKYSLLSDCFIPRGSDAFGVSRRGESIIGKVRSVLPEESTGMFLDLRDWGEFGGRLGVRKEVL